MSLRGRLLFLVRAAPRRRSLSRAGEAEHRSGPYASASSKPSPTPSVHPAERSLEDERSAPLRPSLWPSGFSG
jgi:hypothetical protein